MKEFFSKIKAMPITMKAAMWFTICNIFLKGISLISTPIFTRLLPDSEYGVLSLFLSYEHIIMILATFEIHIGAYQKGIFKYNKDEQQFTTVMQALINIITIAFFGMIFIFADNVCKLTDMTFTVLIMMMIYAIVYPSYFMWTLRMQKAYNYMPVVIVTIVHSIVVTVIPMLVITIFGRTGETKYIWQTLVTVIFCTPFFVKNLCNMCAFKDRVLVKEQCKYALKFQMPLILHSLSFYVLSQADRVMIGVMVSKAATGYYSVAYSLASVVSLIQTSLNQVLTPWRYSKLEEKKYDDIKKNTNYVLIGISLIVLLFIVVAPEIMRILFSTDYYEAVWSIPPISVSMFFIFLYSIFVNMETFFEKTKYITYVSIVCGVLNILLNYYCIDVFGYIACGYTTLFSYVIFSIGHYFFAKKICKENELDINKVFDIKNIVLISVVLIALSILMTLLYSYFVLRCISMVVIVAIMIVNKDKFIGIIRKRG